MRIYLQLTSKDARTPLFTQLILQEDLLGGWSLIKESGQQGKKGRVSREHFDSHEAAVSALEQARNSQIKRGYQVMFVQGR